MIQMQIYYDKLMCGFDAVAPLIVPLYLYYATELCVCVCVPQPSSTNPTQAVLCCRLEKLKETSDVMM